MDQLPQRGSYIMGSMSVVRIC